MIKNWILEKDVFSENLEPLMEQIERQGMSYEIVEYIPFGGGDYSRFKKEDLFYGCLEFGERLRAESECTIFHTPEKFLCSYYYPRFGKYLFNENYVMLSYGDLKRRQNFLFKQFGSGEHDCIFVRPDSGAKTFTGLVMARNTIDQDMEFIERYSDIPPETLIIVAPAQNTGMEYRFVVSGQKVITGSLYKRGSDLVTDLINKDHEAFKYAQHVVNNVKFSPDPMWVIDVITDNCGGWAVLEVGCFSSAGLYAADKSKIVNKVKEL